MATSKRAVGEMFYSNCLLEAVKAKIRNPKIKITYLPPTINECFCPHFMWSDGKSDYDFGVERYLRWYERFWVKGQIRERRLGFNKKWKAYRIEKIKKRKQGIEIPNFEEVKDEV